MMKAQNEGISNLNGFFVSNVFVWTYEDTLNSDKANNTDFAKFWCDAAKQNGYIYVVQIAGFGTKI